MATNCTSIIRSLAWCQGTPELPGIKRRIYYIGKDQIVKWPTLNHDTRGRLVTAAYAGNFVLAADATWKYIDILPDKSQLTSEAQGEYPSMTQLNKLTAVHPGVGIEASALAAYVNNNDCVFLVETVRGKYRVVGSEAWQVKSTVAQDLGQGATGTTSTTLSVEATDECPAPFYFGKIETEDGIIQPEQAQPANGGTAAIEFDGSTYTHDNMDDWWKPSMRRFSNNMQVTRHSPQQTSSSVSPNGDKPLTLATPKEWLTPFLRRSRVLPSIWERSCAT